jgi:hypothetical protein
MDEGRSIRPPRAVAARRRPTFTDGPVRAAHARPAVEGGAP